MKRKTVLLGILYWAAGAHGTKIEWNPSIKHPVLKYERIYRADQCRGDRPLSESVDLPPGTVFDLSEWFHQGTAWQVQVIDAKDTTLRTYGDCVVIGIDYWKYLSMDWRYFGENGEDWEYYDPPRDSSTEGKTPKAPSMRLNL